MISKALMSWPRQKTKAMDITRWVILLVESLTLNQSLCTCPALKFRTRMKVGCSARKRKQDMYVIGIQVILNSGYLQASTQFPSIQGTSKRLFPGCVKSGEKVAFCLPSAGRKTQFSTTYPKSLDIYTTHILTTWEEPFRDSMYIHTTY